MSDNRDESTGQFSSAEPLTGRAGEEQAAGYVPYADESAPETETDELTVAEAVDQSVSRTPESEIRTYSAIDDLPDNVSLTVEQAAQIKTDNDAADAEQAKLEEDDRFQKEVDEIRGVKPDAKPEQPLTPEAEVEKFLAIPHVKDAVEKLTTEAETARQTHLTGLAAATQLAHIGWMSKYPEFEGVTTAEQSAQIARMIGQNDPQRLAAIQRDGAIAMQQLQRLEAAQQQQTERERLEFQRYSKAEDARFEGMMKGENMAAIEAQIPLTIKAAGADPAEFLKAGTESKWLRSAPAQAILAKAAKYDLIMNAKKAIAARQVPLVQRPGVARAAVSSVTERQRGLAEAFNHNPSLKNAQALYVAQLESQSRRRAS